MIGHTQPRRIAARSVAERIAEELGTELGATARRLPGPLHRPDRALEPDQADDRRHPARRAAARPRPEALRHDHHRRGPRAQPQHRLPARVPQAAAAPPARPQADHHLRDDRPRPVRPALRRRRAVRRRSSRSPVARTPSRSATDRSSSCPEEDEEGEAIVRDQTEAIVDGVRRARPRGAGRHPGLPAGRAGDPRHRRGADRQHRPARPAWRRDRAALLPALRRRAAQGLRPAHRPADRAGHQRRRDVADRARHPVRRRLRRRPYLPLLGPHQGAAAADRGDQPGLGPAAVRALRPRRGGHRDPALLRGGLRVPAGVHRARDPAHQPGLGHPPDDLAAARRHRPVPVRRAAGQAQHHRRRPAARGARGDWSRDWRRRASSTSGRRGGPR